MAVNYLEFTRAPWADCARMKRASCFGLLWVSLFAVVTQGASSRLPRVYLFGADYVRLEDWARTQGGQVRWVTPKDQVRVTVPGGNLLFKVDSTRVSVKGTHISLSEPVAFKNGSAYIGAVDVAATLGPILSPPKMAAGRRVKSIVLDPGHGGKDPGNQEGHRQEKQFTLTLARELSDLLTRAGFTVSLTRTKDAFVDLPERPDIARRRRADLFISLHFNSADGRGGSAVQGTEVFCMTPARTSSTHARGQGGASGAYPGNRFDPLNMLLAYQLQKAITEKTGAEDRGVKRARFAVLRSAAMPAAYVEGGFMTNSRDARRIYDPVQRRQMAQAIVDGVLAYKRLVER
jgi:N-acetylmuramoyl-L-alanine amidase